MLSKIIGLFRGRSSQEELHDSVAVTVRKSGSLPHLLYIEIKIPVDSEPLAVLNLESVPRLVSESSIVPPSVVYSVAHRMLDTMLVDTTVVVKRSGRDVLLVRQQA